MPHVEFLAFISTPQPTLIQLFGKIIPYIHLIIGEFIVNRLKRLICLEFKTPFWNLTFVLPLNLWKKIPRQFTWTHSRNSFDPVSIEDVIDPANDTLILLNCYCLTKAGYHALEEFDVTITFIPGHTLCTHLYKIESLPGLETCVFWMTYKICCEILVRLGPTVLLIAMNVAIIRNFNLSVRRKKKLKASKFVKRTSSQLFPNRNSSFFEAPASKISIKNKTWVLILNRDFMHSAFTSTFLK